MSCGDLLRREEGIVSPSLSIGIGTSLPPARNRAALAMTKSKQGKLDQLKP
jgi:hypothetical protein